MRITYIPIQKGFLLSKGMYKDKYLKRKCHQQTLFRILAFMESNHGQKAFWVHENKGKYFSSDDNIVQSKIPVGELLFICKLFNILTYYKRKAR